MDIDAVDVGRCDLQLSDRRAADGLDAKHLPWTCGEELRRVRDQIDIAIQKIVRAS